MFTYIAAITRERFMSLILVTGATGFVGSALIPALLAAGHQVRATTRNVSRAPVIPGVEWVRCDVYDRGDVERAMLGIEAAYFLVHGMGANQADYAAKERRSASEFAAAAEVAGCKRVLYLGGVAPASNPSEHLKSRLDVGEILRAGAVPTLELRASMIVGYGSASWQIVRDITLRLPAMLLPKWTLSRTSPIAVQDVVVALVRGLSVPLSKSEWYDIPGPEVLSGADIMRRLAALRGRRVVALKVPFLSVSVSSWWLRLVARTDFHLARELVLGFSNDLLPRDARYWDEISYHPQWSFDEAARFALKQEFTELTVRGISGKLAESFVQWISPKLSHAVRLS